MSNKTLDTSTEIDLFGTDVDVDFTYKGNDVEITSARINDMNVSDMLDRLYVDEQGTFVKASTYAAEIILDQINEGAFDEEME